MFDMRYHIASLVAVFLALAVGIVLGTVIVDKGVLVDQQKAMVERLEKDFKLLRAENAALNSELRKKDQYLKESFFPLIKDRLIGQNIAIIVTSATDGSLKRSIEEAIRRSGASVVTISLNLPWRLEEKNIQEKLAPHIQQAQGATTQEKVLTRLADYCSSPPADNKVLMDLAAAGLIGVDSLPQVQPTAVLIVGGSDGRDTSREVDAVLIERLKANKVRVVGVEPKSRKISYMGIYQRLGISTVDNVDEQVGLLSTVFALAGADGNFGVKSTADRMMPAFGQ